MKKVFVCNGPNPDLPCRREPALYGCCIVGLGGRGYLLANQALQALLD